MGRHKVVGQGVLVVAVAAAYYLVAVAALATWLGSPPINISCLQALINRGHVSLDLSRIGDLSSCSRRVRWSYQAPSDPG